MKPDWDENTYEQQFDSSLLRSPKARPVPVTTNLRMMTESTALEIRLYVHEVDGVPTYEFDSGAGQPSNQTVRALGRHYFTWY